MLWSAISQRQGWVLWMLGARHASSTTREGGADTTMVASLHLAYMQARPQLCDAAELRS